MGIDRIGKGPPAASPETQAQTQGPTATDKKSGAETSFSVGGAEAADRTRQTAAASEIGAASPLARLRAGEIDLDRYVDLKVDEATRGLAGLSRAELDDIKTILRDQIVTDPGLSDLVRTATGKAPTPPED